MCNFHFYSSIFNSSRFSIIQGGQERFVITQGGNVGIGNETPDRRLYVDANDNQWTGTFRNVHASAYGLSVDLSQSTASNLYALAVYTPSNSGLFINNHGDVNIGNSSAPGLPLMVNANNTGKIAAFVNRSSGTQGITIGTTTDLKWFWMLRALFSIRPLTSPMSKRTCGSSMTLAL